MWIYKVWVSLGSGKMYYCFSSWFTANWLLLWVVALLFSGTLNINFSLNINILNYSWICSNWQISSTCGAYVQARWTQFQSTPILITTFSRKALWVSRYSNHRRRTGHNNIHCIIGKLVCTVIIIGIFHCIYILFVQAVSESVVK